MGVLGTPQELPRVNTPMSALMESLDTGFRHFRSPTSIDGLAKVEGDSLMVLAVSARTSGVGQLRNFITQAKREYKSIVFYEVWNPALRNALARYGFTPYAFLDTHTNDQVNGLRWEAA